MNWILVLNTWSRWGLFQNISRFTIEVLSLGMETVSFQGFTNVFFSKKRGSELGGRLPELWPQPIEIFVRIHYQKAFIPPKFDDLLQKRQLESQDEVICFFSFYWSFNAPPPSQLYRVERKD